MPRILFMGLGGFLGQSIDNTNFMSQATLLDYDIVLWNPGEILITESTKKNSQGLITVDDINSGRIMSAIHRRKAEITEMLTLGRTIIVLNAIPEKYYISRIGVVSVFHNLFEKDVSIVLANGKNIEFKGEEPFTTFWKVNRNIFRYEGYFKETIGKPIFFIQGTSYVVGSHFMLGNGNLIFIPSISDDAEEKVIINFIGSLIILVEQLNKKNLNHVSFELPTWSKKYNLSEENEKRKNLFVLKEQMDFINMQIEEEQQSIHELEKNKILFTGSGKELEIQVKRIFEELGFIVTEGLPGRDDLILEYENKIAVVEVKGVSKSAAESYAAQLEKWVSEYYLTKGVKAKGILIVNSYKDLPLTRRKEASFPHQMLDYCEKREHCLITGLQLLGLYLECKDSDKKDSMIELLFATKGIFSEYQNWANFIASDDEVS